MSTHVELNATPAHLVLALVHLLARRRKLRDRVLCEQRRLPNTPSGGVQQ